MYIIGNKIVICQLQNAKSNFPGFCKVHAQQNHKSKCDTFIYTFNRDLCFDSSIKNCFQEAFLVNVIITKENTAYS